MLEEYLKKNNSLESYLLLSDEGGNGQGVGCSSRQAVVYGSAVRQAVAPGTRSAESTASGVQDEKGDVAQATGRHDTVLPGTNVYNEIECVMLNNKFFVYG